MENQDGYRTIVNGYVYRICEFDYDGQLCSAEIPLCQN